MAEKVLVDSLNWNLYKHLRKIPLFCSICVKKVMAKYVFQISFSCRKMKTEYVKIFFLQFDWENTICKFLCVIFFFKNFARRKKQHIWKKNNIIENVAQEMNFKTQLFIPVFLKSHVYVYFFYCILLRF